MLDLQFIPVIGAIIAFIEWRFRAIHACLHRIEDRLDRHLDKKIDS